MLSSLIHYLFKSPESLLNTVWFGTVLDRPDANSSLLPTMRLTMKGGGQFILYDPVIVISSQV